MFKKRYAVIPALVLALVIGCGGSDSGSDDTTDNGNMSEGGDNTGGDNTGGDNTGGDNTGGDNTGGDNVSFFNDEAGFDFANTLGARLASLFSTAFGVLDDDGAAKRQIQAEQTQTFQCSGGGSTSITYNINDDTGEITSIVMSFADCNEDGDTTNGSLSITGTNFAGTDGSGSVTISLNNLAVTGSDPVSMNGDITATTNIVGNETTVTINGSGITMVAEGETVTFSNYSMTAVNNDATGGASVAVNATVQSSIDGTVTVVIDPPFSSPDDSSDGPTTGVMVMTHSDGSSLRIDADTGNPATFSYTVTDTDGVTTSGIANWADTGFI